MELREKTISIDEAITHQTSLRNSDMLRFDPELRKSCDLGIEALKRINALRERYGPAPQFQLPGETEK